MLIEGSQRGIIEKRQSNDMAPNVIRLADRHIASPMTPRSKIVHLDIEQPFAHSLEMLITSDHSRFPGCRGGMYYVLGVITAKRLLRHQLQGKSDEKFIRHLLPAIYVPQSLTGMKILEQFRASGIQMFFVVDEYGEILGLLTLQDTLEALTWQFRSHSRGDIWALQREDSSWIINRLIQSRKPRICWN